jgi:hypothetical protein
MEAKAEDAVLLAICYGFAALIGFGLVFANVKLQVTGSTRQDILHFLENR